MDISPLDISPPRITLTTLALRVAARTNIGAWSLVLVPSGSAPDVAAALAEEVRSLDDAEVVQCNASADPAVLARLLKSKHGATLIVTGIENAGWPALDLARSRFEGAAEVIIVSPADKGAAFISEAPHLASWFGPSIWFLDLAADDADDQQSKNARLEALRMRFAMTDADVIAAAELGRLRADPEFAEWLMLLGRGDLVDG